MKKGVNPFSALKFHDFRIFWLGLLISRIGSEMQVVAVNWHVYLETNSALSLGLIGLSRFIPIILFSLLAGIVCDIYNRRRIMGIAQIVMMIISIIFALTTILGVINPTLIYILIAIQSAASIFDTPARQAITPSLVPKKYFMNAVGLNTIMWQSAIIIGPAIAGFIIAFFGVTAVYLFNTISFFAVFFALYFMKENKKLNKPANFDLNSLKEGLQFVRKTPIIYSTMLLDFFATFFSSGTVLLPIFAKEILTVGPVGMGLLYASSSMGAVFAGLFVSSLGHLKNQGKILIVSVCIYGLATILFGISRYFYLSLIFLFITGVGDVISTIIRNTIRQLSTPDYLRGRMTSINMIFFMGGPQLGEAEAGIAAAMFGAPASVVLGGVGTIITTILLAYFIPVLRKYKGDEVIVS